MSQQLIIQSALAKLLCGNVVVDGDGIDEVLSHLDEWLFELRKKDFERFYNETLNDFSSLYSEFSKGVHHELVIPLNSAFDLDTTKRLLEKTIRNIATLALIVSIVSYAVNKLDPQVAIAAYKEIQEMGVF